MERSCIALVYFARKPQPGLREKIMASDGNMIDGVREPTVLIRNGLSIVSLYQYRNNLPEKFLKGLEDTGSAKAEVAADAKAALDQAKLVGQPEGSAIYFGVDFSLSPRADAGDLGVLQVGIDIQARRAFTGRPKPATVNLVLKEMPLSAVIEIDGSFV